MPTRSRLTFALLFLCALLESGGEARACSMVESYRVPTNFELVQRAELILLARVVAGPTASDAVGMTEPQVVIEPVRVLKGQLNGDPPRLAGYLQWGETLVPPMPTPLYASHFSAGLGACIRLFYPRGGLVVAMFETTPNGLFQIADAWARAVEDVEAPDGVWVRAIEEYLELQRSVPPERLTEAIERRRDELRARTGEMAAQAIAFDLDHHLSSARTGTEMGPLPHWLHVDMPGESGAIAGRTGPDRFGLVRCTGGGTAILVEAVGIAGATSLTLSVDGTRFAVAGPQAGEREGRPALVGELEPRPELLAALERASQMVAVEAGDETVASMPPGDVFQKVALRCRALLAPTTAG